MGELLRLVESHRIKGSCQRKNVADPALERVEYKTKGGHKAVFLRRPIPSQTLRSGPIFDLVKAQLPHTEACCYNRNLCCARHKDSRNAGTSHILFLGDFQGGALVFADGRRIEERGVWTQIDGQIEHWNEEITSGTKHSLIAFSNDRMRSCAEAPRQKCKSLPDTLPL